MDKGIITIYVDNEITEKEIKEIRREFKNDKLSDEYKLNIIISGNGCLKENIKDLIMAKICS